MRINAADTAWFADDLAWAGTLELDGIVLPKASPEAVDALGPEGPPVVAIVETALGLRQAFEIASQPRVAALILGSVDLGAEVGLETRSDGQEILYARSKVTFDSAAAGLRGPIDVVHLDFEDTAGLEEQCRLARALGFRGKACIHPAQLETINRVFAPSESEIEWARRVVDAFERPERGRARRQRDDGRQAGGRAGPPRAPRGGPMTAPEEWHGRYYEDFAVGDVFRSRFGRTITDTDNIWFTCLTMNTNPMHFDVPFTERTHFGQPLVNSAFTLALVTGLTVPDTSRERRRQPRLDGHQAAEAGLRRRHALRRERDPGAARVAVEPERRHRLDALPRRQPAPRGRDRVPADVHGLQARGTRGAGHVPRYRRRMDGVSAPSSDTRGLLAR